MATSHAYEQGNEGDAYAKFVHDFFPLKGRNANAEAAHDGASTKASGVAARGPSVVPATGNGFSDDSEGWAVVGNRQSPIECANALGPKNVP